MNIHMTQHSDYDSGRQSPENQTAFLKKKLIQTHNKLLRELELTKELEEQISLGDMRNEQLAAENDGLRKRCEGRVGEEGRGSDKRMKEMENKNNLLRSDLEAMRTRIIAEMLEKTKLEEALQVRIEAVEELEESNRALGSELKRKDQERHLYLQQYNELKLSYEGVFNEANRLKTSCQQLKRNESYLTSRITDLENFLKAQKDRSQVIIGQKRGLEKQLAQLRERVGDNGVILADLNNKIQFEEKEKERLKMTVEKLNYELNQMASKYKMKERELAEQREKPEREMMKMKQNYMESRELVEKLEYQQKEKTSHRKFRNDASPSKSISPLKYSTSGSPPRHDYMDNITEMGKLQNILLKSNIARNKLMTQIDKIEGMKTKTNEIYLRRKQHQQQLNRIQEIIADTKARLRTLNAI